jgi:hypothetical protein
VSKEKADRFCVWYRERGEKTKWQVLKRGTERECRDAVMMTNLFGGPGDFKPGVVEILPAGEKPGGPPRNLVIDAEFQALIPPLDEHERRLLRESILREGCRETVKAWTPPGGDVPVLLDGHNRVEICREVGAVYKVELVDLPDVEACHRWIRENQLGRRNLAAEAKAELVALLLKENPAQSNRRVAKKAKADHKTVQKVRKRLEATGDIPQLDKTTGADGKERRRPTRKPSDNGETAEPQKATLFDGGPASAPASTTPPAPTSPAPPAPDATPDAGTNADIDTEAWALAAREEMDRLLTRMDLARGRLAALVAQFKKDDGHRLLKGRDGKPFESFAKFCKAQPPVGLGRTETNVREHIFTRW